MTNLNSLQKCNGFNFGAEHNGIPCVISTRPEDEGTEHQIWFTRQMLAECFNVGRDTITRHFDFLVGRGVLTVAQNCATVQVANFAGAINNTTLYDLKVFNFLAMRLDTDRAWEVKEKFNDILVEKETKNFPIPETFEDALILAGQQMKLAKEEERKRIQAEQERDEAVKKRKAINDKRTATLMVAKREDNKKINRLTCENNELKEQNEILKVSLGESTQWMSSAQLIQNFKLHRIDGKDVKPRTLTTMLKKCGCRHRESEFPDAKGFKYAIFFVEDVKKALNIF